MPDRLYFTDSDEANELIASDPMALLIGSRSTSIGPSEIETVTRDGGGSGGPTAGFGPARLRESLWTTGGLEV